MPRRGNAQPDPGRAALSIDHDPRVHLVSPVSRPPNTALSARLLGRVEVLHLRRLSEDIRQHGDVGLALLQVAIEGGATRPAGDHGERIWLLAHRTDLRAETALGRAKFGETLIEARLEIVLLTRAWLEVTDADDTGVLGHAEDSSPSK